MSQGLTLRRLDPRLRGDDRSVGVAQLHPVVPPQLLHFRQDPFRTIV